MKRAEKRRSKSRDARLVRVASKSVRCRSRVCGCLAVALRRGKRFCAPCATSFDAARYVMDTSRAALVGYDPLALNHDLCPKYLPPKRTANRRRGMTGDPPRHMTAPKGNTSRVAGAKGRATTPSPPVVRRRAGEGSYAVPRSTPPGSP